MPEKTSVLACVQSEAVQVRKLLEEAHRRVVVQYAAFPVDVEDVPDEMVLWEQCPTPDFFVYGLLSLIMSELETLQQYLQEVVDTSPESVRKEWLRIRRSETENKSS